jgi:recombinational DNA repair ATPase RecF
VYLKSIVLKGFKSFPDRTRLEFGPGVSVVVGPNGSGKSNITDAALPRSRSCAGSIETARASTGSPALAAGWST